MGTCDIDKVKKDLESIFKFFLLLLGLKSDKMN